MEDLAGGLEMKVGWQSKRTKRRQKRWRRRRVREIHRVNGGF